MSKPRALFLSQDGKAYADNLICSGLLPSELDGHPCPYADNGRIPSPQQLDPDAPNYSVDKGRPGDLCPPCVKQKLGSLAHWQGHAGQHFPPALLAHRLFKCQQWFWLVVPGLTDAEPTVIRGATESAGMSADTIEAGS